MKKTILILCMVTGIAHAQTHCSREKIFFIEGNGEMLMQSEKIEAPTVSFNAGISGVYGKGTILDNLSGMIGIKWVQNTWFRHETIAVPAHTVLLPVVSGMYRHRFNGINSSTIHALALSVGVDDRTPKKYFSAQYRCYMAPRGRGIATIAGIVGWENFQGLSIGFNLTGFF